MAGGKGEHGEGAAGSLAAAGHGAGPREHAGGAAGLSGAAAAAHVAGPGGHAGGAAEERARDEQGARVGLGGTASTGAGCTAQHGEHEGQVTVRDSAGGEAGQGVGASVQAGPGWTGAARAPPGSGEVRRSDGPASSHEGGGSVRGGQGCPGWSEAARAPPGSGEARRGDVPTSRREAGGSALDTESVGGRGVQCVTGQALGKPCPHTAHRHTAHPHTPVRPAVPSGRARGSLRGASRIGGAPSSAPGLTGALSRPGPKRVGAAPFPSQRRRPPAHPSRPAPVLI